MNRRCNYKNNHHSLQQRNMFLPIMICSRSSLKDVKPSHCRRRQSSSDDPLSSAPPKCNSKVSGIATPNHPSLNSSATITAKHAAPVRCIGTVKYHNLGRLFSAKSLTKKCTVTTIDSAKVAGSDTVIKNGYIRNYKCDIGSKCGDQHRRKSRVDLDLKASDHINVAELDPPLPVVRRQAETKPESGSGGEARESLWKRRSRGSALGSLEVQFIIHGGGTSLSANTV